MAPPPPPAVHPIKRWFRRWLFRLGLVSIVIILVVVFAPQIAAQGGLLNAVIQGATGDVRGSVRAGGGSLSWWSPPQLQNVELRDHEGRLIVAAPSIRLQRSLLSLLLDGSDLGTIIVEQPTVELVCAGAATNVEDALAAYIDAPASGKPTRTTLRVEITQGKLTFHDADTKRQWTATEVAGTVEAPAERRLPIRIACRGRVNDGGGVLEMDIGYRTGEPQGPGTAPEFRGEFRAERCPAGPIGAVVRRWEPGLEFDGVLNGNLTVIWDDTVPKPSALRISGHVKGENVVIADPHLGPDRLASTTLDFPCNFSVAGSRIVSESTRLKCDLGELSLSGSLDASGDPLDLLQQPGLQISGDVDLARLAASLPRLIRLQKDTAITSGRLALSLRSRADGNAVAWSGRAFAVDLRGRRGSQAIVWDSPTSVEFAARQSPHALPRIDTLKVVSEFGRIDGSGTEEQFTLTGNLDLDVLVRKLGQFVDFGDTKLAGRITAQMHVQRDKQNAVTVAGAGRVQAFEADVGRGTLRERDLQIRLDAKAKPVQERWRLETASLRLTAGANNITLDLVEPLADLSDPSQAAMRIGLAGDLQQFRQYAGAAVEFPAAWRIGGRLDASARLRIQPKSITAEVASGTVQNLAFAGFGLDIAEPRLAYEPVTISFDRAANQVRLTNFGVGTSAAGVRINQLEATFPSGKPLSLAAGGRLTGDLSRLRRWIPALSAEQLAGSIDGSFRVQTDQGVLAGRAEITVQSLAIGDTAKPAWTEPTLRLVADGAYDVDKDQLRLRDVAVSVDAATATAAGPIDKLSSSCDVALAGHVDYDFDKWTPQLRRFLGRDGRVIGQDRRPFRVEGSLAAAAPAASTSPLGRLRGEASAGWKMLQAFGCQVGPAEIRATARGDGWIRLQPIDTTLNQGRLKLEPYIRLDPSPMVLSFGKATGIERARITTEMCAAALGYAAPMFGGVREVGGEFSVVFEGGHVPLADPDKADLAGKLILHSARLTTGPVLQALSVVLRVPPNLSLPKELVIPVRVVDGRAYHRDLDWPFGDVTVRTSGSVGLDGSLAIMAEMPIPPKWLGNTPLPKSAAKIKLPIGGTLSQPRIDEKALQSAIADHLRDTARDALLQEVQKGLQKLFPSK